jgi:hypothetical protein
MEASIEERWEGVVSTATKRVVYVRDRFLCVPPNTFPPSQVLVRSLDNLRLGLAIAGERVNVILFWERECQVLAPPGN